MQELPFIYSDLPRWRVMRHVSFWMSWFVFQLLLYSFSPSAMLQRQSFSHRLLITAPETLIYMLPSFFLAYTLMYWVIPDLVLKKRYILGALSTLVLILITAALSAALSIFVIDHVRHLYADPVSPAIAADPHPPFHIQLGVAMLAGLRGSITVGGVAAAIKLMKCFFEREHVALRAEAARTNAELQILKAQLHPHFLFNTLNNIYSFTQDTSPKASGMIMGLSQLLRYMLYECNKPRVPLDSELKMIRDYVALEIVRHDEDLDIAVKMPRHKSELQIAPLILLPFVENAFKHGTGRMTERPWLNLTIEIDHGALLFKLVNGKPALRGEDNAGIGIVNVRKRLKLLYPGAHELQIKEEEEMYIVNLKLDLATVKEGIAATTE